ncbi:MAG TPA: bifunctional hydroxymethylpyrimidine kinase/phosphomethylpyrimidine kinase [Terriglobales bacterium]
MLQTPPVVLTIAGFDPSSGAGISADIKTIAAHGCYGVAAITALTVQSTSEIRQVAPVDPDLLRHTLDTLSADVKVSAVHVGMLGSGEVASTVADFLQQSAAPNIVLDPVLRSTSGTGLIDNSGIQVMLEKLIPLATAITPNVDEAAALTGLAISHSDEIRQAAERLHEMGAKGIVITGADMEKATDLLSLKSGDFQTFKSERLDSSFTHGTGCAFSTAIACHLAQGRPLAEAVLLAKAYVTAAIANGYPIGKGTNPVNHMYRMKNHPGGYVKKLASGRD